MKFDSELISKIPISDLQKLFTVEWCPCCNFETIIWSRGISRCQFCGSPIVPCSACHYSNGDGCYEKCPYSCGEVSYSSEQDITMPKIEFETVEDCELLYSFL